MANVNQITLIGNLGKDIKMGGADAKPIANFSVATNYDYKNSEGAQVSETEWHRVVTFGHNARYIQEFGSPGRQAYVQGRLRTRKWTDAAGAERRTTEIIADTVSLLGAAPVRSEPEAPPAFSMARPASAPAAAPQASAPLPAAFDDDIPF